jgi:rubrerythrin
VLGLRTVAFGELPTRADATVCRVRKGNAAMKDGNGELVCARCGAHVHHNDVADELCPRCHPVAPEFHPIVTTPNGRGS